SFAEQIAGLNSVVRGNPEGQLKGASGSAMALLAAQAVQFANGFVREWDYFNEDVGTLSVKNLQTYAHTPRIAQVVGKNKRQYIKEFSGDKIAQVTRIRVKTGSAISKTQSGKMTIADNLLERQAVTADGYLKFIETG